MQIAVHTYIQYRVSIKVIYSSSTFDVNLFLLDGLHAIVYAPMAMCEHLVQA